MSLRYALLGLLAAGPASGYDLARRFRDVLGIVWPASHPQIYLELNRLASAKYIAVTDEGPRGRKEYSITPEGQEAVHTWLTEPVSDRSFRNEALLRSFFTFLLTRQEQTESFARESEYYRTMAENYRKLDQRKAEGEFGDEAWVSSARITIEAAIRVFDALAEWAEWAGEQTNEESAKGSRSSSRRGTKRKRS